MKESKGFLADLRRNHPVFFWGTSAVLALLLIATGVVAATIPAYRADAAELEAQLTEAERATRDQILDTQARRSALALALLQRELRLRALQEDGLHLAVSIEDSTLALRNGRATLRETRVVVGRDTTIAAPDGRSWRLVRALGERHLAEKETSPTLTVPEWVYVGRGEAVPPEGERQVEEGLGRYVLRLDDGTEIYTRPEEGPFATGVKPASFMVENEEDLRAIFDALKVDTPVYIY